MWDESRNAHQSTQAGLEKDQHLVDALAEFDLQIALPKDLPTLRVMSMGNYMRPDNMFVSSSLYEAVIQCKTLPEECPAKTDHFLVVTTLSMDPRTQQDTLRPNYRGVDLEEVREEMALRLEKLGPEGEI